MRPAPTISVRLAVRSRTDRVLVTIARSAKRDPAIATMQISASTMKNERRKSRMFCVSTMNESATSSERTTAEAIANASRAPAYRQTER